MSDTSDEANKCGDCGFYRQGFCYLNEKVVSRESEACGEYENEKEK